MSPQRFSLVFLAPLILAACGGGGGSGEPSTAPAAPGLPSSTLSPVALIGQQIFTDQTLSASGRMSCSSCHIPAAGHFAPGTGSGGIGTLDGGAALDQQGGRKSPSMRYLRFAPAFNFDAEGTPNGGFFWDGRATSLADQASKPFFNPVEMALPDHAALAERATRASWAAAFRSQFGEGIFADPDATLDRIAFALQQFQKESADFAPFTSKYDAFLAGTTQLSDVELRGLALFNNPAKGNCAACHPSGKSADGSPPLFTDFSYDNLGVPRNPAIKANADPAFFDLGLCGPNRPDLAGRNDLCGAFKVPTLRNVAVGGPYFHNGRFATLKEALRFYVRRDTNPEEFYPLRADGSVDKFNDLPLALRGYVNTSEAPYNRKPGDVPALNEAELDELAAFLGTLTDGYTR